MVHIHRAFYLSLLILYASGKSFTVTTSISSMSAEAVSTAVDAILKDAKVSKEKLKDLLKKGDEELKPYLDKAKKFSSEKHEELIAPYVGKA